MKSIISLGLAAITAATASAETTIAVLEFGPGGSVRRTASIDESTPAGAASFFSAMHTPSKAHRQQAGMSLVPDIFNRADAGIVLGLSGAGVSSMSSAMDLLAEGASDVVGTFVTTGTSADVMKRASKNSEAVSDEFERHLVSTAENVSSAEMQVVSLLVNDESATEADKQFNRMLASLKAQAKESGKTIVVHVVVDTPPSRRRLEDVQQGEAAQDDAVNQGADASYYYGQKTMYEIQNFNVIAWTTVGLVVLVMYVMSNFIAMPLMPDTLLHGEAAKFGTD